MLLSLDVGFANMGWAVFEDGVVQGCGTIITQKSKKKTTRAADDYAARASRLARELSEIISEYNVKGIVGELPSGGAQNAKAMAQMNMATAVVSAVATLQSLPTEWTTPNEVKLAVTGYRSATKKEIKDTIRKKFKDKGGYLFPKAEGVFEHIADAVGAYLASQDGNLVRMFG
jgi:Holliday junction resolvasome RuvABC endonuclease subunit